MSMAPLSTTSFRVTARNVYHPDSGVMAPFTSVDSVAEQAASIGSANRRALRRMCETGRGCKFERECMNECVSGWLGECIGESIRMESCDVGPTSSRSAIREHTHLIVDNRQRHGVTALERAEIDEVSHRPQRRVDRISRVVVRQYVVGRA